MGNAHLAVTHTVQAVFDAKIALPAAEAIVHVPRLRGDVHRRPVGIAVVRHHAAQALEFRRPLKSSPAIEELFNEYRKSVPFIINDEVMYPYIKKSIEFLNR